jgi:hypothetical protein
MLKAQWAMLNGQCSMPNARSSTQLPTLCIEHCALCLDDVCQSKTATTGPWSLLPNSRWTTHEVAREARDSLAIT